jgi:hypothetical protein
MVSFMAPKNHLEVRLTLPEAKALTRLVNIGISAIEADNEPVGNPVTLQRTRRGMQIGIA